MRPSRCAIGAVRIELDKLQCFPSLLARAGPDLPPGPPAHTFPPGQWKVSFTVQLPRDMLTSSMRSLTARRPPPIDTTAATHSATTSYSVVAPSEIPFAVRSTQSKVNACFCRFVGYSAEDLMGLTPVDLAPPEDQPRERAALAGYLGPQGLDFQAEKRYIRKDGVVIWVQVTATLVLDPQGNPLRSIGIVEQITARKQAEEAIKAAKAEAEQANEAKSRFLAAASHDLRQPLQAINLYLGALAGRLAPGDAPIMKHIDVCLGSLSSLLGDLLDLSKLDADVIRPNNTDFPLAELFRNIVSAHAPAAEAKGLRLLAVSTKLWAKCDPVLVERAVGNLLANAIRYTEQGGVVIGCRRRGGKIWVEVVDSGIGIPIDKHEVIFEEFHQLGNQELSREKGTGLGLAIVKKTAALLGLEIRVTSRLDRGSTFALSVPLGLPARIHASSLSEEGGPLHIALVEDDANVRDALAFAPHLNRPHRHRCAFRGSTLGEDRGSGAGLHSR